MVLDKHNARLILTAIILFSLCLIIPIDVMAQNAGFPGSGTITTVKEWAYGTEVKVIFGILLSVTFILALIPQYRSFGIAGLILTFVGIIGYFGGPVLFERIISFTV